MSESACRMNPGRCCMFKRGVVLAGALAVMLVAPMLAEAAERECDWWLKLVKQTRRGKTRRPTLP